MQGAIEEDFGGEPRSFLVRIGELRAIQTKCSAGPAVVAQRLARCVAVVEAKPDAQVGELAMLGLGDWNVDDVREPILQGLIGAGMSPNDAGKLVRTWVDERGFRGLVENARLALLVLVAGVATPEDDPVGEPKAGETRTTSPAAS